MERIATDAATRHRALVVTVNATGAAQAEQILVVYRCWGINHRCRVAVVTDYLTPAAMLALTYASTFLLTATRAEGAWVVASHPEPTHWPHDPGQRLTTTWHRIVWQSLRDQIDAAYRAARGDRERYARIAARGRQRMRETAATAAVWPRLRAALDEIPDDGAALR